MKVYRIWNINLKVWYKSNVRSFWPTKRGANYTCSRLNNSVWNKKTNTKYIVKEFELKEVEE